MIVWKGLACVRDMPCCLIYGRFNSPISSVINPIIHKLLIFTHVLENIADLLVSFIEKILRSNKYCLNFI